MSFHQNQQIKATGTVRASGVLDEQEKTRLLMKHAGIFKNAIKEYAAMAQKQYKRVNKNYSR